MTNDTQSQTIGAEDPVAVTRAALADAAASQAIPPEPPAAMMLPTLTTKECATRLRISERTLYKYVEQGIVPCVRINARKKLYIWSQVLASISKK